MRMSKLLSPRILIRALIMSLAISGAAYAQQSDEHSKENRAGLQHYREEILAQLPAEKAKLYKDTMQQAYDKNKDTYSQIEKMHAELKETLNADKFDKDVYLAKSAEMEKLYGKMRASSAEAFASVAAQFTPDERKILAKLRHEPRKHDNQVKHDDKESSNQPSSK